MAEAARLFDSNHGKSRPTGIVIAILVVILLGLWIPHHPLVLHATYEHQRIIFTIVIITAGLLLATVILANQLLKWRLRGLLDIFDTGSAVLGAEFITGSFQAHPAWVSVKSGGFLRNHVYICVGRNFSPPFNVQTFRSVRSTRIHMIAESAALLLFWSAYVVFVPDHGPASVVPSITFWNLAILAVWGCWLVALLLLSRRPAKPGITQIDMQLAGDHLTPFETTLPDRLRSALEQQKFREALARIFDSCRADGVRAPADGSAAVGAFWSSTANVFKKQALRKETVRETLIELSTLYTAAEQPFPRPA